MLVYMWYHHMRHDCDTEVYVSIYVVPVYEA
jgi:hypothetical protein